MGCSLVKLTVKSSFTMHHKQNIKYGCRLIELPVNNSRITYTDKNCKTIKLSKLACNQIQFDTICSAIE